MATTPLRVSTLRRLMRLADHEQKAVKQVADIVLKVWPRSAMQPEQQLLFVDDLSVVYRDFGEEILNAAVDDLRQSSEHRPSIKAVRDACAQARSRLKFTPNKKLDEYTALEAKRRAHPEEFMPYGFCERNILELLKVKGARRSSGKPMSRAESREWLQTRTDQCWEEWRVAVRQGKHLSAPIRDVKQLAAGA